MTKCSKCEISIKPDDTASNVSCKLCGLYWHVTCAALRVKPRDSSSWQCTSCKSNSTKKGKQADRSEPSPTNINNAEILKSIKDLRLEMNSIKKDLHAGDILVTLEDRIAAAETKLLELEDISEKIINLQQRVFDLEERNMVLDQADRVRNLELHGLTEYPQEDLTQTVVRAGNMVGLNLNETDLKWVGRVGSKANTSSRPRTVLIKFHNQDVKNNLLRALRKRRGITMQELGYAEETRKVHVSENLTPHFRDIYRAARNLNKFKYVWTYNCRIFIRENDNSELVLVKSKNQLQTLA